MSNQPIAEKDDFRLCPTCRMPISVLATRCRHCGETVGRPRQQEASLSIQDLGGETPVSYKPSSNVMEALEAFRAETENEQARQQPREREASGSVFGRKKDTGEALQATDPNALPELDERSRALAGMDDAPAPQATPAPPAAQTPWQRVVMLTGGFIAAVLLLYFGGNLAVATLQDVVGGNDEVVLIDNPAPDMMAGNAPPLEVLETALDVLERQNTTENQAIAEEARNYFAEEVNRLLNAHPWEWDDLRQASRMTDAASMFDMGRQTQELRQRVERDIQDYGLVLIDVDGDTATFRLNNRFVSEDEATVSEGDRLLERFIVRNVSSRSVQLEDTRVQRPGGGRLLNAPLRGQLRPG